VSTAPKYRKLRTAERSELEKWRSLGEFVILYYTGKPAAPTPAKLESVFALWRADKNRKKLRAPDFAYAFGTLLADHLVAKLDFEWRIITDDQGQDFCLKSAATDWETYPIDYVWKRVKPRAPRDEMGFFTGAWQFWRRKVPRRTAS